jgi:hypothetical protein
VNISYGGTPSGSTSGSPSGNANGANTNGGGGQNLMLQADAGSMANASASNDPATASKGLW